MTNDKKFHGAGVRPPCRRLQGMRCGWAPSFNIFWAGGRTGRIGAAMQGLGYQGPLGFVGLCWTKKSEKINIMRKSGLENLGGFVACHVLRLIPLRAGHSRAPGMPRRWCEPHWRAFRTAIGPAI